MKLERPPQAANGLTRHLLHVYHEIEQADVQNLKLTGDINFPHNLTVQGNLTVEGDITAQNILISTEDSITASTTQTQGQQALTAAANLVETVANANDVVTLPSAVDGLGCEVVNKGANTLQIFPASGDAIEGGATNASTTLAAGSAATFRAFDATDWYLV